jgi:hypothetical protein
MAPMSKCQRDSQEWKRLLSLVDRFFVGQPTIDSDTVVAIDKYCAAKNQTLFKYFMPDADTSLFLLKNLIYLNHWIDSLILRSLY